MPQLSVAELWRSKGGFLQIYCGGPLLHPQLKHAGKALSSGFFGGWVVAGIVVSVRLGSFGGSVVLGAVLDEVCSLGCAVAGMAVLMPLSSLFLLVIVSFADSGEFRESHLDLFVHCRVPPEKQLT